MAEAVVMPRQGQSVETCIITQWLKNKGDQVEEGELLFSYETDKAAFDEVAPLTGTLLEILYEEGDEVPVLQTVAIIGKPGEKIDPLPETTAAADKDAGGSESDSGKGKSSLEMTGNPERGASGIRISPRARNMAKAMQVDIASLEGSGPNGRIIANDVQAALLAREASQAAQQTPAQDHAPARSQSSVTEKQGLSAGSADHPSPPLAAGDDTATDQPLSNIRKVIARNMKASLAHSAQLTHHASADARKILSLRKRIKEGSEQQLPATTTLNDMVCYAIVQVLKETPAMNSHFLDDRIRFFSGVHLGMAVDTPRGLMVPVLKNADRLTLGGLGQSLRELAESCRSGKVDPDLLAADAGSFTVSNLGAYGIEMFTPVLNLPQTGIIGINTITHRPADLGDGNIGFVPHIGISLTYDHRAIDGAPASKFLQEVCSRIAGFDPKI